MKNEKFTFIQKNYGWIIAAISGMSICLSFILRYIKYIHSSLYFNHYGISYELFNSEEIGYLYSFILSIILIMCFYSLIYCFKQIYDFMKKRNKNDIGNFIFNIILIIISNTLITFSSISQIKFWNVVFFAIILFVIEIIMMLVFKVTIYKKSKQEDTIKSIINYIKVIPFYLFLIILLFSYVYIKSLNKINTYRIINDDKVIVYTTSNYYVILDCDIKNDELIIYKGSQMKINNENIETKLMDFNKVKLRQKWLTQYKKSINNIVNAFLLLLHHFYHFLVSMHCQ